MMMMLFVVNHYDAGYDDDDDDANDNVVLSCPSWAKNKSGWLPCRCRRHCVSGPCCNFLLCILYTLFLLLRVRNSILSAENGLFFMTQAHKIELG